MKQNKLNCCALGLFAALTLCVSRVYAGAQAGECKYEKHEGDVVFRWEMKYSDNKNLDTPDSFQAQVGDSKVLSYTTDHASVRTTRAMPGKAVEYTYGNFALTALSNMVFPNPELVLLLIPHKDETHITRAEGERIVSFKIKKGENPRARVQKWTMTYKSGTIGRHCHVDLVCNVKGDGISTAPEGKSQPIEDYDEEQCSKAD
ncbi:MAG: hypothetical protein K0R14_1783 [Burkholderiales bacterium]|nr:hypothetical protein [Burkholderiales bacterium]